MRKISVALLGLVIGLFAFTAFAQTPSGAANQFCTNLTTIIDTKIAKYNNNRDFYVQVYNNRKTVITNVMTDLTSKGYDTAKVMSDLQNVDAQLQKTLADYDAFIQSLQTTKSYTCGNSQGQFAGALAAAGTKLQVVYTDLINLDNAWQTVVRPDIQALRDSIANSGK